MQMTTMNSRSFSYLNCKFCGKYFCSLASLEKHELQHNSVEAPHDKPVRRGGKKPHQTKKIKKFSCDVCDVYFGTMFSLKKHYRRHSGERPFLCQLCQKPFISKGALRLHNKKIHGIHGLNLATGANSSTSEAQETNEPELYFCNECDAVYECRYELYFHRKIHGPWSDGMKPFPCYFCPERFGDRRIRYKHEVSAHTQEQIFACTCCHSVFENAQHLRIHQKSDRSKCYADFQEKNDLK